MTELSLRDRVYLDSNVFIEVFEGRSQLSELLVELLLVAPERQPQRFVTSELTLAELIVQPIEKGRDDLVRAYDNWTISNVHLEVAPVSRENPVECGRAAGTRQKSKATRRDSPNNGDRGEVPAVPDARPAH